MTAALNFSSHHFLVVDDKAFVRTLVSSILWHFSAGSVETASNGAEALSRLAKSDSVIDCLLCDLDMSPVNGLEVVSLIRCGSVKGAPRDLRIILLTGHSEEYLVKTALLLGINGYVVKPITAEKLSNAIAESFLRPLVVKHVAEYAAVFIGEDPRAEPEQTSSAVSLSAWRRSLDEHPASASPAHAVNHPTPTHAAKSAAADGQCLCALDQVLPGDFVARDVVTRRGTLVLSAGVVLTERLIVRLKAANAIEALQDLWVTVADRPSSPRPH